MSLREPARTAACRPRSLTASSSSAVPTTSVTVYGCGPDEAALFRRLAPGLGVRPVITEVPVCEANVGLAAGGRCISIGHKTRVTNATVLALSRVGVRYISTRSVGCNHIDVAYAERVGVRVGTVAYSPDSVADFALMQMLMAIRHAKSVIRRTDRHDYRLESARGRELRDLVVGVVGTGRIGTAVIDRLHGFGCRVLTYDNHAGARAGTEPLALDELVRRSDIVTLHTPLTPDTHHLLDRRRIALMKQGAFVVNTGRGALIDTEALLAALEDGHLAGAALDVVEREDGIFYADFRGRTVPNDALVRLQRLPNVLISPHTAYYTDHALADTVENSLLNCLHFESESHR